MWGQRKLSFCGPDSEQLFHICENDILLILLFLIRLSGCVLQSECVRANHPGQWLWSFDMEQQCLAVQELSPSNISRDESRTISLSVPGLPGLEGGESYSCLFQDSSSTTATTTKMGITCHSPDPARVPMVRPGQDFVTVTLSLRFGDVAVTEKDFTFYDCTAVKQLSGSMPCRGCVLSRWGCNWCVHQHSCTHKSTCEEGVVIYNQHFKLPTSAPPTTKRPTATTTAAVVPATTTTNPTSTTTTTIAPTTSQAPPTTAATTLEPTTPSPPTTSMPITTGRTQTTPSPPAVVPLQRLPTAAPAVPEPEPITPLVPVEEDTATQEDVVIATGVESKEPAVTPSNTAVVTKTNFEPVTGAASSPAEEAQLEPVLPLTIPGTAPWEAAGMAPLPTESPSQPQAEAERGGGASSLTEPTMADGTSGGFSGIHPLPTPFPMGEPLESEDLDREQAVPSPLAPTLQSLPDARRPIDGVETQGAHSEVLPWSEEEEEDDDDGGNQGVLEGEGEDDTSMGKTGTNDTVTTFSAAALLSGDGEAGDPPASYPRLMDADLELDYLFDMSDGFLPGDKGSYVSWGSSACPCVEKVQGLPLLPVQVERKITLLARNLHIYQDKDYECVLVIEGRTVVVDAYVEMDEINSSIFYITCQLHKYSYSSLVEEYNAMVYVKRRDTFHVDSPPDLRVTLYNCSAGRADCSRCHTANRKYDCVWCGGGQASCLYSESCGSEPVQQTCPAPLIHDIEPLSGLLEGGTQVTIWGSNLGQKAEDILHSVKVARVPCTVIPSLYEISTRIVCKTRASGGEKMGQVSVEVSGRESGLSSQIFSYQDPFVMGVSPERGPKAGGTTLTITGAQPADRPPLRPRHHRGGGALQHIQEASVVCVTGPCNRSGEQHVTLRYGASQRHLHSATYRYTPNPNVTHAAPANSFLHGGRLIYVSGHSLDVVQEPRMVVTITPMETVSQTQRRRRRRRIRSGGEEEPGRGVPLNRQIRRVADPVCPGDPLCSVKQFTERCEVNSSSLILCRSPAVDNSVWGSEVTVEFLLDNLRFHFSHLNAQPFHYEPNPLLHPLNQQEPLKAYRYNPGSFIQLEGENLDLAITKEEVVVLVGEGVCAVKTLTRNHLYCEPPTQQPGPGPHGKKREGSDSLPEFTVQMGNLNFSLGKVQYDTLSLATFPMEAQVGVGVGASIVALIVFIIVLIYRRKSKQALRDYKKVQIQLENLETSVRDRCKKEFTDLMTEMMDMSSDLVGSGIPFLDYRKYAERIFFPGHRESPLRRDLDVQEGRRQTVEQGLVQLSNLLNSKLFLTKFIHTLEGQRTFSPRDRAYVASLLTVALHGKLEYFTDILKTLLNDLVEQYVAKNPKLMLRRTETVVEKLLTNWMSICLYAFLRDSAGESLYMLFRAIKHQVDKGPVDAVTGKAKYTLNDNRLLREDVEYKTLTLNVLTQGGGVNESQPLPSKVLDIDTISQVKEKLLEQVYKGTTFSQRPHVDSLDLEWRSGVAGHLILSDEDLTSVVQGNWKRLNTLQHYKVPDGATVVLVPRHTKHIHHDNHDYVAGEKTPMLEDADEGGVRLWHLVKASEEPELPKHRRGSLRERERAKAIPEIYLTRLLSMKGTLQKFVDDLFTVILSTSRPVPLAVKYFFDLLDDQAGNHGISDPETIHIWKTNSEGKREHDIDRRMGAVSAVMQALYRTVVVNRELS
ncbi:Plexin-B1 [Merluccius polli]|uniref:Plexin-B1 n=1 Tax=Merluccius polli TaxID=89951 RepID=A0AA47M6C8_MERPO|nr:Plexin-B1 [Merluccius polli]